MTETFAFGDRVRAVNAGGRWRAMGGATISGGDDTSLTVVFDSEPDADYRFTADELERINDDPEVGRPGAVAAESVAGHESDDRRSAGTESTVAETSATPAGAPVAATGELAALTEACRRLMSAGVLQAEINAAIYRKLDQVQQRLEDLEHQRVDIRSGPTRRRRVAIKKMAKGYQWEGTSEIDGAGPGVDLDALQDAELTAIDRAARRAIEAAEYTDANGLSGSDDIPDDTF